MGVYDFIKPDTIVRLDTGGSGSAREPGGDLAMEYDTALNDQVKVLKTWRPPGQPRMVYVQHIQPNYGKELRFASELRPLEENHA